MLVHNIVIIKERWFLKTKNGFGHYDCSTHNFAEIEVREKRNWNKKRIVDFLKELWGKVSKATGSISCKTCFATWENLNWCVAKLKNLLEGNSKYGVHDPSTFCKPRKTSLKEKQTKSLDFNFHCSVRWNFDLSKSVDEK